jgi:hypothetical protein
MRGVEGGGVIPTHDENILRILGEAAEPLYASEITDRLNDELDPGAASTVPEVVGRLKFLRGQVAQLPDGRWMLRRKMV